MDSWMAGHEATLRHEESRGLEKGRKARIDSPAVEMNTHLPAYSMLLQDGIWIITRWLAEGQELSPRPEYAIIITRRRGSVWDSAGQEEGG